MFDNSGAAMGEQEFQFRILNAISREFSSEQNFPTSLDAALSIRNVLKDPFGTLVTLTQAVSREPLVAARVGIQCQRQLAAAAQRAGP